jgi:hypothetical protein
LRTAALNQQSKSSSSGSVSVCSWWALLVPRERDSSSMNGEQRPVDKGGQLPGFVWA